jgi:quinol monooxygenase YgiN
MLIVAGTVRAPPHRIADLAPAMLAMVTATRAEDGCMAYAFAEDLLERGLIRVFEVWRDEAALAAHFRSPHMAAWRAASATAEISDRALRLYDIADDRPL